MDIIIDNEENFKELIRNPHSDIAKPYTIQIGWNKAFQNLTYKGILNLGYNEKYDKALIFENCFFDKTLIESTEFKEFVWFKNCSFEDDFIIYDGSFTTLIFDNCEFKKSLTILDITVNKLSINNSISKNPILIKGGRYTNLHYNSSTEKTHLRINGLFTFIGFFSLKTAIGANVTVNNSIIRNIKIEGDYNSSSRVNFKEIQNFDISIDNTNNDGKFYFTNFYTKNIIRLNFPTIEYAIQKIEDPTSKDELHNFVRYNPQIKTFQNLYNHISLKEDLKKILYVYLFKEVLISSPIDNNEKPIFAIKYSSIGTLELKSMVLEKYSPLIISSDLSSIKLIDTFFPTEEKPFTHSDGLNLFNDLYTSASKQNNLNDKIEYYKASQKFLYKKLYHQKKSKRVIGSLISISTSKFYSNHGSSWIKAAVITFIILAFPMFGLFVFSLKKISLDFSVTGFKYFSSEILPYFPQFINPIHKIEFMESISSLGEYSSWVDLFSRVLIGIGVFEMIRSFRKFVRN